VSASVYTLGGRVFSSSITLALIGKGVTVGVADAGSVAIHLWFFFPAFGFSTIALDGVSIGLLLGLRLGLTRWLTAP
jgi:hypothetical protein